ncbi:MAG: ATP-binding protein, partial [Bacillota bacterium]|nr:ATP-binding protein [Bacillota bacterium]
LVAVIDQGPGIPENWQVNIFQPFVQVGESRTKGTGLGLALVKKLTELQGGKVWVESTPGEGASFYVTLAKKGVRR